MPTSLQWIPDNQKIINFLLHTLFLEENSLSWNQTFPNFPSGSFCLSFFLIKFHRAVFEVWITSQQKTFFTSANFFPLSSILAKKTKDPLLNMLLIKAAFTNQKHGWFTLRRGLGWRLAAILVSATTFSTHAQASHPVWLILHSCAQWKSSQNNHVMSVTSRKSQPIRRQEPGLLQLRLLQTRKDLSERAPSLPRASLTSLSQITTPLLSWPTC